MTVTVDRTAIKSQAFCKSLTARDLDKLCEMADTSSRRRLVSNAAGNDAPSDEYGDFTGVPTSPGSTENAPFTTRRTSTDTQFVLIMPTIGIWPLLIIESRVRRWNSKSFQSLFRRVVSRLARWLSLFDCRHESSSYARAVRAHNEVGGVVARAATAGARLDEPRTFGITKATKQQTQESKMKNLRMQCPLGAESGTM